ncbi:hypothetical protein [Agromyces sp. Marseille-P2726]|uniref:hypothetical protein n=1 Tax=Agromyces sp. Marseille-P2726 TaxID=2709132 RepID=UPI00156EA56A|nr:hypothetical protein [Agromyces sp. Marseille-P2726]
MGTGPEDPLVRRRDELRRIVYGTRGEPSPDVVEELERVEDELARAAGARDVEPGRVTLGGRAAQQHHDLADRAPAAPRASVQSDAPLRSESPSEPSHPAEVPEWEGPGARRRRPWLKWVLAASVAVVGIALVVGPVRDLLSPPRGLDVFDRTQTEEEQDAADQVATGARLDPYEPEGLRSLGSLFGYQFWTYLDGDRVCLLSQRQYFFSWEETCSTVDEFRVQALSRRISTDDIRQGARPPRWQPGDVIVVTWGAMSMELEWEVEPRS